MHEQDFATFRDSLIAAKLQKDTTLRSESSRHWYVIAEGRTAFNRHLAEAAELQKLTLQDVLRFFDAHIAKGSEGRRLLLCRVYCSAHAADDNLEKECGSTIDGKSHAALPPAAQPAEDS